MENNLENKERFFAQYYGQKVLTSEKVIELTKVDRFWAWGHKGYYLELTPLSMISDEDAIEIMDLFENNFDRDIKIVQGRQLIEDFKRGNLNRFGLTVEDLISISDRLRKLSFALKYDNLSVEQQIEYGWIKIKK